MTDTQLYLAIGVPILFNAALIGVLIAYVNGIGSSLNSRLAAGESALNNRLAASESSLNNRLAASESSLNSRMTALEARMLSLENTFTTRFDLLMGRLIELEKEIHGKQ